MVKHCIIKQSTLEWLMDLVEGRYENVVPTMDWQDALKASAYTLDHYVVQPKNPTPEMTSAGRDALLEEGIHKPTKTDARAAYKAMLLASPVYP